MGPTFRVPRSEFRVLKHTGFYSQGRGGISMLKTQSISGISHPTVYLPTRFNTF